MNQLIYNLSYRAEMSYGNCGAQNEWMEILRVNFKCIYYKGNYDR